MTLQSVLSTFGSMEIGGSEGESSCDARSPYNILISVPETGFPGTCLVDHAAASPYDVNHCCIDSSSLLY